MKKWGVFGTWIYGGILAATLALGMNTSAHAQEPVALPFGQALFGGACNGSVGLYEFPAQQGDVVRLIGVECYEVGGRCSPGCCCFDQNITVMSGETVIAQNQNGDNHNYCGVLDHVTIGPLRVTGAGPFTMALRDNTGWGGGGYTVYAQRLNNPVGATTIVAGETVHGVLNSCGEVHTYQVAASSGDRIVVDAVPELDSTANPRVELFDEGGKVVAIRPDGRVDSVVCESGMYTLLVYSYLNTIGAYAVSVAIDPGNSVCSPASLPSCPTTTLPQATTTTIFDGGTTTSTLPENCSTPTTSVPPTTLPGTCQVMIASCDSDGDGNPDLLDRCPRTQAGKSVNDSGCSLAEFCDEINIRSAQGKKSCRTASWQNETFGPRTKNKDCKVDRASRTCVAVR